MAQPPQPTTVADVEAFSGSAEVVSAPKTTGLCEPVGLFMSRDSGGAGWSNSPRPDLARGAPGQLGAPTLRCELKTQDCPGAGARPYQSGGGQTKTNGVDLIRHTVPPRRTSPRSRPLQT